MSKDFSVCNGSLWGFVSLTSFASSYSVLSEKGCMINIGRYKQVNRSGNFVNRTWKKGIRKERM